jgi:hypothetical protein
MALKPRRRNVLGLRRATVVDRLDDRCGIRTGLSVAVLHDGIAGSEPFARAGRGTAKHLRKALWALPALFFVGLKLA